MPVAITCNYHILKPSEAFSAAVVARVVLNDGFLRRLQFRSVPEREISWNLLAVSAMISVYRLQIK